MITTQLRAGAEKCAEKLSKSVLNKIEQRLLQKQRAGQFRTFLGALVLINCAERMTWLYQAYQNDESLKVRTIISFFILFVFVRLNAQLIVAMVMAIAVATRSQTRTLRRPRRTIRKYSQRTSQNALSRSCIDCRS